MVKCGVTIKMAKGKSKKSVARKAAPEKSNKFLIWAVVIVVIVVILFLMRGGKEAPEAPTAPAPVVEAPVVKDTSQVEDLDKNAVPETAPGESLLQEEELATGEYTQESRVGDPQFEDEQLAKDTTAEPERFSNFECSLDEETGLRYLSLKVTNINEERPMLISHVGVSKEYNTYFMTRGNIDFDPGCGVEELAPGESTVCSKVGPENPVYTLTEGINRLNIQTKDDSGSLVTEAVIINCE